MREMKINTFRKPANRLLVALLVASLAASLSVTPARGSLSSRRGAATRRRFWSIFPAARWLTRRAWPFWSQFSSGHSEKEKNSA